MSTLNLTPDELLSTTRSVRKRLDFARPVEREVIEQCLELAMQAPNGGNRQPWHFMVVTDAAKRQTLGDIYRKGWAKYLSLPINQPETFAKLAQRSPERAQAQLRVASSAQYLADHMHEAPVLLVPCVWGRADGLPTEEQAGLWGSILPAAWSFMLAARSRGLGTSLTTVHLFYEQEAADALGIPFARVAQAGLIPVAYTLGTDFKPAPRESLEKAVHWNAW
ncbi:MAG: nitroreductase family protein [Ktedonobacterales bacterium]